MVYNKFKTIILRKLSKLKGTPIDYSVKSGKQFMNKTRNSKKRKIILKPRNYGAKEYNAWNEGAYTTATLIKQKKKICEPEDWLFESIHQRIKKKRMKRNKAYRIYGVPSSIMEVQTGEEKEKERHIAFF